jgi:hypothetical protein
MVECQAGGYAGDRFTLHAKRTRMSPPRTPTSPCAVCTSASSPQPSDGDVEPLSNLPSMSQKYFLTQSWKSFWVGVPLSLLSQA